MSSYSSSRSLDPSSKSSTAPRLQPSSGGRAIYCPLDPKCTTLHPIDDQPVAATVFHTLQEPLCRRMIPVSTPTVPRAVTAQQLLLQRPPCTCSVRATSLVSCNAGQTRPPWTGGQSARTLLIDDDCAPAATVTFTTFKPASPENEYGTPSKPRLNRPPCHHVEPSSCCAGTPQGKRRAPTAGVERRPDICCQEPTMTTEGNVTV